MQEIIISKKEDTKLIMLIEDGKLVEYYEDKVTHNRLEGNIYNAKIRNIVPGMQAAFVDIGEGKNTFIQAKDLIPKKDQTKEMNNEIVDIKQIAKIGMNVIVQVKKDANHKKGARVSTHINLPGKYIAYMPDTDFITISQKIEDKTKRENLKQYVKENLPKGSGAIIRTAAENINLEEIEKEIKLLIESWENIKNNTKADEIKLLYKSDNIITKIIKDTIGLNISKVTVDSDEDYEEVRQVINKLPKNNISIEKVENSLSKYSLETQIEKMHQRKIWLKCGGFITIDKTEALTAIDVNSCKYTGKENQEQTIYTVNKEATEEIAKQLRLRDIDGIIIIDYIDMTLDENKKKIIELLKQNIKKDRSKIQILEFTKLNLLEITRKHMFSNNI